MSALPPSPLQVTVLRAGAVLLLVAAAVLAVVAVVVDPDPAPQAQVVDDPADVLLPELGLFGGSVTVYAAGAEPGLAPADLGCELVDDSGTPQSSAKIRSLLVPDDTVEVDGQRLRPLFEVGNYPDDARLQCPGASAVAPLAVSTSSTFGSLGGTVRATALSASGVCLLVGLIGLMVLRRRTPG